MRHNDDDKLTRLVQSSTRSLMESFRDKTRSLSKCSNDVKLLLREGCDLRIAKQTAEKFFGNTKISFIAIDGTGSQDQELDMLIFYAGAFGYTGQIEFVQKGCSCGEILEASAISNVSAAIPIHEEDASNVVGESTEGGVEVDPERLPSTLMQFAEYYMAVKSIDENPNLKIVLLDRTLAGDAGHLIWRTSELINQKRCMLQRIETEFGTVTPLDLELSRMLHPNDKLKIPAPRSQFIKYAAINELLRSIAEGDSKGATSSIGYEDLLNKIGAKRSRLGKLANNLSKFNELYSFLKENDVAGSSGLVIKPNTKGYWQRVFSATMKVAQHIFDPPSGKHPLIYEQDSADEPENKGDNNSSSNSNSKGKSTNKRWITSADLEYMTLVMIYALLRAAWEKNVLVIGLTKDTAAAELIKTVVPILQNARKLNMIGEGQGGVAATGSSSSSSSSITGGGLPKFNSDKQLLQTSSIINGQLVKTPWRTFEFDACFRTMAPLINNKNYENKNKPDNNISNNNKINQARVKGAFKNVISLERMFVKSYVQLWKSENDPTVRSHVFSYDRPCYPGLDTADELLLLHPDGNVDEEIRPMIHFDKDCEISHLVMDILCSMASEVIPECLGHNYPLFLADKKAKCILEEMKTGYLSAVAFEMANSEFDQQVLYEARFRDFRLQMENSRRTKS